MSNERMSFLASKSDSGFRPVSEGHLSVPAAYMPMIAQWHQSH